ncbi:rhomboid family intramembrane serine protease [Allobranchiibius sp. CTAmp26]|uniref:rhomboid family intramembrane serine protease n=1 Tax=Allobranchiibius sp. CTAmp26 TaxID=2815214 RepID=UPI001AA0BC3E|nr:rhomboid family intramembrane serine protease [Allobranchiibius sp. CTAmp26]MBO1755071.1 rhomboid family intramembrane serine protease [Allobranchiibius sp. CTAmp26]
MTAPDQPVCPRHPDRVAYVRCQVCDRPTCPDCQRPAPVGIHCVDCVRASAKTFRSATTVFGGRVALGRPVVTISLIVVCTAIWLVQQVYSPLTAEFFYAPVQTGDQPYRLLTATFLHQPNGVTHLLFNMFALWIAGQFLEPALGRARFLAIYLICGLAGSVGVELLAAAPSATSAGGWYTPTLGASGAIMGLFGAAVVCNRRLGVPIGGLVGLLVINVLVGFVVSGIAWQAHLGGAIVGLGCGAVATYLGAERRRWQWPVYAAIVVLLVVLATVRFESVAVPAIVGL